MPLFKMSFKEAWTLAERDREDEFRRIIGDSGPTDLAVTVMQAFAAQAARRNKPLTEHDLVGFTMTSLGLESRRQRALFYKKLVGPTREALQILEHAELVYLTVKTDSADVWTATSKGLIAVNRGENAIRQAVEGRTVATSPPESEPTSPPLDRLQQLEDLRAAGALSDDEYTAARQRIIDSL